MCFLNSNNRIFLSSVWPYVIFSSAPLPLPVYFSMPRIYNFCYQTDDMTVIRNFHPNIVTVRLVASCISMPNVVMYVMIYRTDLVISHRSVTHFMQGS